MVAGLFPNTKTVLLVADETFLHSNKRLWKWISPIANRTIDKAICVSRLAEDWMQNVIDVPSSIVHPPINQEKYHKFKSIKKAYEIDGRPEIVTLANLYGEKSLYKKNTRRLADATQNIGRLTILGAGHDDFDYSNYDHVRTLGYVSIDRIKEIFKKSDVFALPSNNDTFPVSTLEAMLAGLPTIVSDMCGTKSCVEPVDTRLVCETSAESISSALDYIISKDATYRKNIGSKLRDQVEDLTPTNQAHKFRQEIESI